MTKTAYQIPFSKAGSQYHYAIPGEDRNGLVEWRDNTIFEAVLHTDHASRGQSSVVIDMVDGKGIHYSVSLADYMTLVPEMVKGDVRAVWTFVKRGKNYFCTPTQVLPL